MTTELSRRSLFKTAAAASLLPTFGAAAAFSPLAQAAEAPKRARTVEEICKMTPIDMARESAVVQTAYQMICDCAGRIRDPKLRALIEDILKNPSAMIAEGVNDADLLASLKAAGYVPNDRTKALPEIADPKKAPQPFWSAPGSGYGSHHAYPGGLCTHVAVNVVAAEDLYNNYRNVDALTVDYDDAVGGEILHDLHKPWVFQWQADGSSRTELSLAKTGEHHVLSIAESMKRGFPASFVVAQACAHDHPGSKGGEELVVGWIRCAALIAGKDPVKEGYLASDGKTLPLPRRIEGFVVHLADHDWVISVPACQWTVEALRRLAADKYGIRDEKRFNAFRNYVLANLTAMRLYGILSSKGEEAFAADVARVVKA